MTNQDLSIYCGHYFSEESLLARQIILVDNILFYQRNPDSKTELIPAGENRFQLKETELFLQFAISGQNKTMTMQEKEYSDIIFQEYFPQIFDPVKFLANNIEKVWGSQFPDPTRCIDFIDFFSNFRKERMKYPLAHSDQSALSFIPLKDKSVDLTKSGLIITDTTTLPLPESDEDIAFASMVELSAWIKSGKLSCERLANIYLNRLKKYGDTLKCVITLTEDLAIKQAKRADLEISQGNYRGVLHGIPYGLKDIVDTAGIPTTWGMDCYRNRIPTEDATIVKSLTEAGAVLVAKLSLHRMAGEIPGFVGDTRNPWNLEYSSGGSSSGSAASVAAGLVGFSIGSEIGGSIAGPCTFCSATGLRFSFGRVSATGVLSTGSIDKLGAICRTAEDTAIVLSAINGFDEEDVNSQDIPFYFNAKSKMPKLRIGFNQDWFRVDELDACERSMLNKVRTHFDIVEFSDSELDFDPAMIANFYLHLAANEFGTAVDDLTYQNFDKIADVDDREVLDMAPFRMLSALEYNHLQQLRRKTMKKMQKLFEKVDLIVVPPDNSPSSQIFNITGHPTLVIPGGHDAQTGGSSITLIGRMYDEATICRAGMELEKLFNFKERPIAYKMSEL